MKKIIIIIKTVVILSVAIPILILGFILPPVIIPPAKLGPELSGNFHMAMEPLGAFLLTAKIISNESNQYKNRCRDVYEEILLQSYTWMMIPGPVIEACVYRDDQGRITGMKSIGTIKKQKAN